MVLPFLPQIWQGKRNRTGSMNKCVNQFSTSGKLGGHTIPQLPLERVLKYAYWKVTFSLSGARAPRASALLSEFLTVLNAHLSLSCSKKTCQRSLKLSWTIMSTKKHVHHGNVWQIMTTGRLAPHPQSIGISMQKLKVTHSVQQTWRLQIRIVQLFWRAHPIRMDPVHTLTQL